MAVVGQAMHFQDTDQGLGISVRPEIPTERTAVVVAALWERQQFTTREVAELTGLTRQGAFDLMCRIGRVLPIVQIDNTWVRMNGED